MKITQTLTRQEVLSPIAKLPWNYGTTGRDVLPLPGVMIYHEIDGTITIHPHNTSLPTGFNNYTITLVNLTVNQSEIIQMCEYHLNPCHHYLLTMQGFKLIPDGKGYETETRVLEFTPET